MVLSVADVYGEESVTNVEFENIGRPKVIHPQDVAMTVGNVGEVRIDATGFDPLKLEVISTDVQRLPQSNISSMERNNFSWNLTLSSNIEVLCASLCA